MLGAVATRPVIVALALLGGAIATLGTRMQRRAAAEGEHRARLVLRTGYAVTGRSIALFVAAGFLGEG